MKTITSILLIVAMFSAFAQPAPKPASDTGIPGFAYIHDTKKFTPEGAKDLTSDARRALRFAKGVVSLRLEAKVEGTYSIAEAAWGFQVNFSGLKVMKNGTLTEVPEGFGEVFLNKGLDKIQINYGP
jgi:hypothetical protein